MIPAVQSLVHLLQSYGTLSYKHLKLWFRSTTLPPPKLGQLPSQIGQAKKETPPEKYGTEASRGRPSKDILRKVLDMPLELGIVYRMDKDSPGKGCQIIIIGAHGYGQGGRRCDNGPYHTNRITVAAGRVRSQSNLLLWKRRSAHVHLVAVGHTGLDMGGWRGRAKDEAEDWHAV